MSAKENPAEAAPEDQAEEQYEKQVTLDDALKLAQAHHRSGNLTIADRTYRDILRAVPDHFPTVHFLAMLLFQRGSIEEALQYAAKAIEAAPERAATWVHYGIILSANEKNEEALEALDEALMVDPELFEAYSNKAFVLWKLERFEEAEEVASQAAMMNPDNVDALINLGISLASQSKLEEAEEVWEQAAALNPDMAKIYSNWCYTLYSLGRYEEAKQKGRRALELEPENYEAWNNIANAHRELGEIDDALEAYRNATMHKPDFVKAHMNMATAYLDQRKHREALTAARYAVSFEPKSAAALSLLAHAQKEMGLLDDAYQSADKAVNLKPEDPMALLNFADVLIEMENFDEADIMVGRAVALNSDDPRTLLRLAQVRNGQKRETEAVGILDRVLEVAPDHLPVLIEKSKILLHDNRIEEALAAADQALALSPRNPSVLLHKIDTLLTVNRKDEAAALLEESRGLLEDSPAFYLHLTSYKKFEPDDPDFIRMKEMAKKPETHGPWAHSILNYALFKVYEDLKDYEQSFEHLKIANDSKKEKEQYSYESDRLSAARVKESFTPARLKEYEGRGCDSDLPVFILGMPRSGTTLTEQIISSHPEVFPAGELSDLSSVIRELGPLEPDVAAEMGEAYVNKIKARNKSGKEVKRITDKMPGNFQNIGLIHCILPHAKIIHCRRDPMDNLLSCYKQNFAVGHYWSYDLVNAGLHYNVYRDIMEHWRTVLPGSFLEIDYEDTVSNLEEQARRLIDFVGLEWDDACLEPHKQRRAVLTASKNQVIKPVYKSSVEAWKRYEKQLQPMKDALENPEKFNAS